MTLRDYLRALAASLVLCAFALGSVLLLHALAAFEAARWLFSVPMRLFGAKPEAPAVRREVR
jgi:hypothetical protein